MIVISTTITIVIFLLLVKFISNLIFSRRGSVIKKGEVGEFRVEKILTKQLGVSNVFKNLYIPNYYGNTTEVDVVFVHKTGIYVIESKNYGGYVVGSSEDVHWYQRFKNDRRKQFKFYNPIFQNNGHVKRLSKVLGKDIDRYFVPIVVFGNRCDIRKLKISIEHNVVSINRLVKVIEREIRTRETVLNEKEVAWVSNKLQTYTNASEELKKEHAINANKTKKYAEKNL